MVDPRVFRTYDIRAVVPALVDENSIYHGKVGSTDSFQAPLEEEGVRRIGQGLARFFGAREVAVGHDARLSSPAWRDALAEGLRSEGVDVLDLGLTSTDMVYYASGRYQVPGVQITASHCTRELNGMKIVRAGAHVVGRGSGMEDLARLVLEEKFTGSARPGRLERRCLLDEYVDHVLGLVDLTEMRPMRMAADAGNGVGGVVAEAIAARLPALTLDGMCMEPDGTFPNHEANPFEAENIQHLIARVAEGGYDFAAAWDGDADRVVFLDERGSPIAGDFITALVARYFLELHPGSAIVYDLRSSWVVRDWVLRLGGEPVEERVGHSFIKQTMRARNAVFGGEVSGHYYFRDHFYADNGFLPWLAVMRMLSAADSPMSGLIAGLGEYYISGEINSTVPDCDAALKRLGEAYRDAAEISWKDGISVVYPDWHFNVRPSANDPVVRLNLEARTREEMERRRDEVLALIRAA